MGSFDTYCAICGGQSDVGMNASFWEEKEDVNLWEDTEIPDLPIKTGEFANLIFDEKDLAFQKELAVLGPIKDGQPMFRGEDAPPSRDAILSVKLEDIQCLHDMTTEDYGVVEAKIDAGEWKTWAQVGDNTSYLWAHETCLRLLRSFTRFTDQTFWDLFRHTNFEHFEGYACLVKTIDYLEISPSHDQFVFVWHGVKGLEIRDAFSKLNSLPNPISSLRKLLLEDGQMWAFVAPDRFPIKKALGHRFSTFPERLSEGDKTHAVSKLPADVLGSIATLLSAGDILSLLLVSNSLRSKLLDIIDWAAKQAIHSESPWMLARGEEETTRWEKEVAEAGGSEKAFRWFVYLWMCERSTSMWNRRRIWKILKQMETLGEELGILT